MVGRQQSTRPQAKGEDARLLDNELDFMCSISGQEKSDEVMRFFSVLQDLHEAHLAVEEEEERARNKNNFLLELQT